MLLSSFLKSGFVTEVSLWGFTCFHHHFIPKLGHWAVVASVREQGRPDVGGNWHSLGDSPPSSLSGEWLPTQGLGEFVQKGSFLEGHWQVPGTLKAREETTPPLPCSTEQPRGSKCCCPGGGGGGVGYHQSHDPSVAGAQGQLWGGSRRHVSRVGNKFRAGVKTVQNLSWGYTMGQGFYRVGSSQLGGKGNNVLFFRIKKPTARVLCTGPAQGLYGSPQGCKQCCPQPEPQA